MVQLADSDIDVFRERLHGTVFTPADAEYDTARSVWNGNINRHPAIIARCTTAGDVAAALAFGREQGLEISVRGGGHNFAGTAVVEGGLMVDLSGMRAVSVDPAARRAVAGGGSTWADLDGATQEHGLAVPGGFISHTGIGGLTLGGGLGWLTRKAGLSIDNLVAAEVVTADGRILRASAEENPDLFWAIRGGGGNFGVVTSFEYRLHEVGPMVHLGLFFWPAEQGVEALKFSRDFIETIPEEYAGFIAGLSAPPAPFVPEEHHFRTGFALVVVGFEDAEEHARVIAPVRETLPPLVELVTPMPYAALQQMFDDSAAWGVHGYEKAVYLDAITDEVIEVMADFVPRKTSPLTFVPIFNLSGAFSRVGEDDTAFGGSRAPGFGFNIAAICPTAEMLEVDRAWVREFWDALLPYARGAGSYVNFMAEYEEDRVRAAYGPAKYERLSQIKAKYDLDNVFHVNVNIKPAR
jgi:FAD/FMN-containing dehydrogenase